MEEMSTTVATLPVRLQEATKRVSLEPPATTRIVVVAAILHIHGMATTTHIQVTVLGLLLLLLLELLPRCP